MAGARRGERRVPGAFSFSALRAALAAFFSRRAAFAAFFSARAASSSAVRFGIVGASRRATRTQARVCDRELARARIGRRGVLLTSAAQHALLVIGAALVLRPTVERMLKHQLLHGEPLRVRLVLVDQLLPPDPY